MKSFNLFSGTALAIWTAAALLVPSLQGAVYYSNPVMPGDHADPSVIRVGNEYWATATSSEWGPYFPLLHSKDLVNWELAGPVFSKRPEWATANFWAPEIAEHQGRYFIYYTARKQGGPLAVAVATADHPAGPWTDHGPLVAQDAGSIDGVPFTGEDGRRYLIWKEDGNSRRLPTILWVQELNEEGTRLIGQPPRELLRNDLPWEGAVIEGPFVVRRDGWFYLFYAGGACCGRGCSYAQGVARSRSILGPYEKHPDGPLMTGSELWKCPGHGSIVEDGQGRYWFMYHAYSAKDSVYTGRQGLLDEVVFTNGWPVINEGKGPSDRALSPFGVADRKAELAFRDEFTDPKLRPGWQWPQGEEPAFELNPQNGGELIVSIKTRPDDITSAVLARSTTTGDYVATTAIDTAALGAKGTAGLSAFGDRANAVGVIAGQGKVVLWRRERGKQAELAEIALPKGEQVHLQLAAVDGHKFRFAASVDGRNWMPIGDDVEGRHLPPWDRSVRVALTAGGAADAQARFDFLRITPVK
jgi:xylan 1,4-beta-xylosidase